MRSYTPTLLLLFAFLAGTTPLAFGQSTGQCNPGNAERDLDVNNVLARMFNTGSLFYGNTTTSGLGYLVPKASGNSPIFASGIWIGGQADGELRVAGATYQDFEFWPGPLNDDGTLPNRNDCSEYDRIWKVSSLDILSYEATGVASADLSSWPAELGAPVIAAPGNGFDDDGDGLTDEGTDGIDNDEDGFIDERDEQERVVPAVREAAGMPIYNLASGDRPEIIGDQALWWVMNDVGNVHANTLSPPIGVEVQVLAFSFARADALNDVTFYRYTVIKKSPGVLEETYFSIFSDPDLGDAADDFVGVDTTLSLGFVYNEADVDGIYGVPPATGYDFFQGPIVDADGDGEVDDTLGVTRFSYFENVLGCVPTSDPCTGDAIYNYMQGEWADGVPMTEGGNGYQTNGPITTFAFPGDPVTGQFWSEVNVDGSGQPNPSGDRRFLVTTGPFDLAQGDSQTIVYGIVFGQGTHKHNSITVMRNSDALAQAAYDADFELASAPPPPPRCNPNSELLAPGSGNCLEAVELSGEAALVWGYPTTDPNYLGSYEVFDQLLAQQDVPDKTYNFEGFHIYRYPNANFEQSERELLATYDLINDVTTVIDTAFSAEIGDLVPFVALRAENTGIRYTFDLTQLGLTNYQDYYFGITTFAHNFWSVPKVIESSATQITVRPSNITAAGGGSEAPAGVGDFIVGTRAAGAGEGLVRARIVDPTQITGATYTVEVDTVDTGAPRPDSLATVFNILRDGEVVFSGKDAFHNVRTAVDSTGLLIMPGEQEIVVDGIEFFQVTPPEVPSAFEATDADETPNYVGSGAGIVEVAHPGAEVCPEDPVDLGCRFPDYLGGNSVWQSPNSTDSYVLTNPSNTIGDVAAIAAAAPDDYEIRFTEACAAEGACLGVAVDGLGDLRSDAARVVSVPFEIVNVGSGRAGFEEDDVRMIPLLRTDDASLANWANTFPSEQDVTVVTREEIELEDDQEPSDLDLEDNQQIVSVDGDRVVIATTSTLELPVTAGVIGLMPDRPEGYELFEADARSFGIGNFYLTEEDGDEQVDVLPTTGAECRIQHYYVDFCYKGASSLFVGVLGGNNGFLLADYDMNGSTPPAGTAIRFLTSPKPGVRVGDRVVFDTADIAFQSGVSEVAQESLDLIGIVPNPYMGRSAYETGNLDRVVRFINMPDQATIRIYTVSGTLIRTLQKDGPSRSLDWDLNTHNQLPVASGMYLIHVDVPGVGEKVLKFGVVNRRNRITVF